MEKNKKKLAKRKPVPFISKRPSFKILRIVTMIVLGVLMVLAIIAIIIKYYQIVTGK